MERGESLSKYRVDRCITISSFVRKKIIYFSYCRDDGSGGKGWRWRWRFPISDRDSQRMKDRMVEGEFNLI